VLSEAVSDAHLAGLRGEGVSYIFAGKSQIDIGLTLEILNRDHAAELQTVLVSPRTFPSTTVPVAWRSMRSRFERRKLKPE
jgi:hypothetical protein